MLFRRVHVHGAGRRGADAWPTASPDAGVFVSFPADMTVAEQAEHLVQSFGDQPTVFFAHSIGAVPVVLAAARLAPAGLVLVEPALYDIARGDAAIERHIGIVTEARALAVAGDLRGFWGILRPLMFGGPHDSTTWEDERAMAQRWATTNLPWGHGVRAGMLHGTPTLVVTGGWNAEYDQIAARLASEGAEHVVLTGAAHRAQDAPGFAAAVDDFERSLSC